LKNGIKKKFATNNFNDKKILELGSGFGFLLRAIYNHLPEDCTYIAIDNDLEQHKFVKKSKAYFQKFQT